MAWYVLYVGEGRVSGPRERMRQLGLFDGVWEMVRIVVRIVL